jgi:hypothetical protein
VTAIVAAVVAVTAVMTTVVVVVAVIVATFEVVIVVVPLFHLNKSKNIIFSPSDGFQWNSASLCNSNISQ